MIGFIKQKQKEKRPLSYQGYTILEMEERIAALEELGGDDTLLTDMEAEAVQLAITALNNIRQNMEVMEAA